MAQSRRLAELAPRSSRLAYLKFALDLPHERARDDDFDRLRMPTGNVDPLRMRMIAELHADARKRRDAISGQTGAIEGRDRRPEEMTREIGVPRRALERVFTPERNDLTF
jgi:hypothetical protein